MTPLNTYHAVRGQCAPDGYMGSYLPALFVPFRRCSIFRSSPDFDNFSCDCRRGEPDAPRWIDPTVWKFMTSKERLDVEHGAGRALIGAGVVNGAFGGLGVMLGARRSFNKTKAFPLALL
jgi:hypothetical protein